MFLTFKRCSTNDAAAILAMIILVSTIAVCDITVSNGSHFVYLAKAFLRGQTWVEPIPHQMNDFAYFQGHWYWPLGPLPAVLLIPGIVVSRFFGGEFTQGYLQLPLIGGILFFLYRLARHHNFSFGDSLFMAFAFVGASTFLDIALAPFSWYFAHAVTVFFLCLALYEFYEKKRWWVIGCAVALASLARATAGIGILFFLLSLVTEKASWKNRIQNAVVLLIPLGLAALATAFYNFIRFQNALEPGYHYQILIPALVTARDYGMFSLIHLPGNLYYFFLGMPQPVFRDGVSRVLAAPYLLPDPWGMSIFIMSPYYLSLFSSSPKTQRERFLWATVIAIAVPVFLYYGIGYIQIGYRYALDFLPFLFLIFIIHLERTNESLSLRMRILFVLSFLLNFYFTLIYRTAGNP